MTSVLCSPLDAGAVPADAAYNRSHTRMATCSGTNVTVWQGGSGDPMWSRLASWEAAPCPLSHVRIRASVLEPQMCL